MPTQKNSLASNYVNLGLAFDDSSGRITQLTTAQTNEWDMGAFLSGLLAYYVDRNAKAPSLQKRVLIFGAWSLANKVEFALEIIRILLQDGFKIYFYYPNELVAIESIESDDEFIEKAQRIAPVSITEITNYSTLALDLALDEIKIIDYFSLNNIIAMYKKAIGYTENTRMIREFVYHRNIDVGVNLYHEIMDNEINHNLLILDDLSQRNDYQSIVDSFESGIPIDIIISMDLYTSSQLLNPTLIRYIISTLSIDTIVVRAYSAESLRFLAGLFKKAKKIILDVRDPYVDIGSVYPPDDNAISIVQELLHGHLVPLEKLSHISMSLVESSGSYEGFLSSYGIEDLSPLLERIYHLDLSLISPGVATLRNFQDLSTLAIEPLTSTHPYVYILKNLGNLKSLSVNVDKDSPNFFMAIPFLSAEEKKNLFENLHRLRIRNEIHIKHYGETEQVTVESMAIVLKNTKNLACLRLNTFQLFGNACMVLSSEDLDRITRNLETICFHYAAGTQNASFLPTPQQFQNLIAGGHIGDMIDHTVISHLGNEDLLQIFGKLRIVNFKLHGRAKPKFKIEQRYRVEQRFRILKSLRHPIYLKLELDSEGLNMVGSLKGHSLRHLFASLRELHIEFLYKTLSTEQVNTILRIFITSKNLRVLRLYNLDSNTFKKIANLKVPDMKRIYSKLYSLDITLQRKNSVSNPHVRNLNKYLSKSAVEILDSSIYRIDRRNALYATSKNQRKAKSRTQPRYKKGKISFDANTRKKSRNHLMQICFKKSKVLPNFYRKRIIGKVITNGSKISFDYDLSNLITPPTQQVDENTLLTKDRETASDPLYDYSYVPMVTITSDWQPLTTLHRVDTILLVYVEDAEVVIGYSFHYNQYYIKLAAQHDPITRDVSYIICFDPEKWWQQFRSLLPTAHPTEYPESNSNTINLKIPNILQADLERCNGDKPTVALARVEILTAYFKSFGEGDLETLPRSPTQLDQAEAMLRERKGSCRHRTWLFLMLAQQYGIHANDVFNDLHATIEFTPSDNRDPELWQPRNLGGYQGESRIVGFQGHMERPITPADTILERCRPYCTWSNDSIKIQNISELMHHLLPTQDVEESVHSRNILITLDGTAQLDALVSHLMQTQQSREQSGRVFYIDSPESIRRGFVAVKINAGQHTQVSGDFKRFLENRQPGDILIFNWNNFTPAERALYKSVLDDERTTDGLLVNQPQQLTVISMLTKNSSNQSDVFYSRHGTKIDVNFKIEQPFHIKLESKIEIEEEEEGEEHSRENTLILTINLYDDDFLWQELLLGKIIPTNHGYEYQPGILDEATELANNAQEGEHIELILQNHPQNSREFKLCMREIQYRPERLTNGDYVDKPKNLHFSYRKTPYAKPVFVQTRGPKKPFLLNHETMPLLFKRHILNENGNPRRIPGIIEDYVGKGMIIEPLTLLICSKFRASELARIADYAQSRHCHLNFMKLSDYPSERTATPQQRTLIVRTDDIDQYTRQLSQHCVSTRFPCEQTCVHSSSALHVSGATYSRGWPSYSAGGVTQGYYMSTSSAFEQNIQSSQADMLGALYFGQSQTTGDGDLTSWGYTPPLFLSRDVQPGIVLEASGADGTWTQPVLPLQEARTFDGWDVPRSFSGSTTPEYPIPTSHTSEQNIHLFTLSKNSHYSDVVVRATRRGKSFFL